MKARYLCTFLLLIVIAVTSSAIAQSDRRAGKGKNYPDSFIITLDELNNIFGAKQGTRINSTNRYLNKAEVLINTVVIENKQLKLKLNYFKPAHLIVQVNGDNPPIIFVMSDKNNVFYTNNMDGNFSIKDNQITMIKCLKDDIISE